ncbi:hypothetical protein ELI13_37870 [Rhizobium ruizarguesonis]|uniref:Uncharacterized protein n=1 Tax=Rhizobium ruizarguesonis TaxID=2081791 RepID=A0ABY1WX93_9HYPH|nr:hypothetical protein [Rhizobium ruizarguesonis]TAU13008.1 hypothetical protein ELI48_38455 [Rhizobium ruizarguesonis]TAU57006.1 hypothetical protein ELI45_38405 [Rhizobium ruizarguesonis]TAU57210.1 hypothetical protein ELI46_40165 [Rhizobium ruizarguesonis]TAV01702.1 hypothetical protein ELI34_38465 [Rhizobium ruizarguesonis]TAV18977.1 hypothetical protein ELI36_38080 [Rhizobium ruizarguesonis]
MAEAIFLSAGVPDPRRGPEFAATADTVAINAAVSALAYVALGRRRLVWGGHPAITPMILVMSEGMGVDYAEWVTLYQSEFFQDEFPEDNERFRNVVLTEKLEHDRDASLQLMRERMFKENDFAAAVFIGGMGGIVTEYEMFSKLQPSAKVLPVTSTGGAALDVAAKLSNLPPDFQDQRDYVALFHEHLNISVKEERFRVPGDQPVVVEERFWRPTH